MSAQARRLDEDRAHCVKCGRPTTWAQGKRGAAFLRCQGGCGDRFPCQAARCGHQDCERARLYLAGKKDTPL